MLTLSHPCMGTQMPSLSLYPCWNPLPFKLWIPPHLSPYLGESGCLHRIWDKNTVSWWYWKGLGRLYPLLFMTAGGNAPGGVWDAEPWQEAQLPTAHTRPATLAQLTAARTCKSPSQTLIPYPGNTQTHRTEMQPTGAQRHMEYSKIKRGKQIDNAGSN